MPRTGRPRKYQHPVRLVVWLEARELRRLHAVAKAAGFPMTSAWARQVLIEVARGAVADVSQRRAARGRDAVERRGHTADGKPRGPQAGRTLLPAPRRADATPLQVARDRGPDRAPGARSRRSRRRAHAPRPRR